MPLFQHTGIQHRSDGSIELSDYGTQVSFTPAELRAALLFDSLLRQNQVKEGQTVFPGFYEAFVTIWNSLDHCKYKFATYNYNTAQSVITGPAISYNSLIAPTHSSSSSSPDDSLGLPPSKRHLGQKLLLNAAETLFRNEAFQDRKRRERLDQKAFKPEKRGREDEPVAGPSKKIRARNRSLSLESAIYAEDSGSLAVANAADTVMEETGVQEETEGAVDEKKKKKNAELKSKERV